MRRIGGCAMTPHPAGEREPPTPKSWQLIISGAYANDTPLQPQSERSKRRRQWVGPRENHAGVKVPWCWSPPAVRFMPLFNMNLLFRERGKVLKNSNLIRYSMQLAFLKQLLDKKLITDKEYSLIKNRLMKDYKVVSNLMA